MAATMQQSKDKSKNIIPVDMNIKLPNANLIVSMLQEKISILINNAINAEITPMIYLYFFIALWYWL
jgi:hypothetical protein